MVKFQLNVTIINQRNQKKEVKRHFKAEFDNKSKQQQKLKHVILRKCVFVVATRICAKKINERRF